MRAGQLGDGRCGVSKAESVVPTIGKKETSATTTSVGRTVKPSHNTSSGARIGIGIACEATSSG